MGRAPILRSKVLEIIADSEQPISFSNIKHLVEQARDKSIENKSLSLALNKLMETNAIEKILIDKRLKYQTTRSYYRQSLKNNIIKLVRKHEVINIVETMKVDEEIPRVVIVTPRPLEIHELASKIGVAIEVEWSEPAQGISSILLNDFLQLPNSIAEGLKNLIAGSVWIGIRDYIENFLFKPLEQTITKNLEFVKQCAGEAEKQGDLERFEAEKALIQILEITAQLIRQKNLADFLAFSREKTKQIQNLQGIILSNLGHFMGGGETVFDGLALDIAQRFFDGLEITGLLGSLKQQLKMKHILESKKVWTPFLLEVIGMIPETKLSTFTGNLDETTKEVRKYKLFLNPLCDILRKRRIIAMYLWNFQEVDGLLDACFKMPSFESWLRALQKGHLNHRRWLFEENTIQKFQKAYRAVRGGKKPDSVAIYPEFWNLKDLYDFHPRGNDPNFWLEIIDALRKIREG